MGRPLSGAESGLASALLPRVRLDILCLLFGRPDQQFNTSEIIRLVGSGSGGVQRELKRLAKAGILTATASGNQLLYQANRQSPIYEELSGLVTKTVGLVEPIRKALWPYRKLVSVAFVYGSLSKGLDTAASDIDLMIIGENLAYGPVYGALQKAEKILRRSLNPNVMSGDEWRRKLDHKSAFVTKVAGEPKLFIIGSENELRGIGQSRTGGSAEA